MLKDAIDLSTLKRVLVIKLRHHGDVLLTSPVFSVLKSHAPHLEIDALVYRDTAEMLTFHPAISQVHTVDRKWKSAGILPQARAEWGLLSALRARSYDLVIHLTEHNRGAWIKRLVGAKYGVARKIGGKNKFWYGSFSHQYPVTSVNTRHTVELNLDALRRIGIQPEAEQRKLVLVAGEEADQSIRTIMSEHHLERGRFIHLHPASRWLFKCWPSEKVSALIGALKKENYPVVITAAPDVMEQALIQEIIKPLTSPVINLAGKLSLKQLAALSAQAALFVGVDSAPMHIAAAMGAPVVALFGPSGDKEWGPWMTPHRIIASEHSCRPCGNDGCGGGKISECLTAIPVERVLAEIHALLP